MNASRLITLGLTMLLATCTFKRELVEPAEGDNTVSTGWLGNENLSSVPVTTNFGFSASGNLPASVDLSQYLPPIGDQGQYGTCVAWATAYYAKTMIEGLAYNYTSTQLANRSYQISPRDLFTSLPDSKKGKKCGGTLFDDAMSLLQQRGAATLATVPYTNLGDCSAATASASWATEAAKHKIKSYRTIDPSIATIKQQLANKVPVVLGAKLSDNFMTWNSDNVLSSNTTYTRVGQHAYHALTIVGYDDRKGANGAFKVVNSWNTNWGSKGIIWIDYNFLLNTFAQNDGTGKKVLMVMTENTTKPDPQPTPQPNKPTGIDLVAWVYDDFSTYTQTGNPTSRGLSMNIYNVGSGDATPRAPWKLYYMYYNAYNANDYGLLFYNTHTTQGLGVNKYQCVGNNCSYNITIPAYSNLSKVLFNHNNGVQVNYNVPAALNGSYYLVLLVDPENALNDTDPEDNYFYTTSDPIRFKNGYGARKDAENVAFSFKNLVSPMVGKTQRRQFTTAVTPTNLNAYSPEEIADFLRQEQKNGGLSRKLAQSAQQTNLTNARPSSPH
ncbi:C1 family peptidase [Fibrella aquatilis]|uniref:C1 family peptidase n=1 Tax=Fibrella aquatilis TaxID=2817059 RepID=A0A939G8J9_9BACT|nr:C1 family peptidase [Fibrella aquatilis]MBO0933841.1 C1 family peptidase [Fibrella aquatilis]